MWVLVCGGRDFTSYETIWRELDAFHAKTPISLLIHGDAKGADSLADLWANRRGVSRVKFPANWERDGKKAGPLRNQWMLDFMKPAAVVSFPGGRGTADMMKRARSAGVRVCEIQLAI